MELYIRASETMQRIAMTTFDFYECGAFSGCLQCVDNNYACEWCVYENTCTGDANTTCTISSSNEVVGSRVGFIETFLHIFLNSPGFSVSGPVAKT